MVADDFQYPVFGSSVCNKDEIARIYLVRHFQYPVFGSSVCNFVARV